MQNVSRAKHFIPVAAPQATLPGARQTRRQRSDRTGCNARLAARLQPAARCREQAPRHPLAGQGMNLGFADIDALLAVLAQRDQQSDCGDMRTLGRYARARKEEVMLMRIATDGLQRLFSSDLAPLRLLRNAGLGLVDRLPFLKRRLITHAMGKANPHTFE